MGGPVFLFASFVNPHDICQVARHQSLPQGPIEPPASGAECPNLPYNFAEPAFGPEILHFVRLHSPRIYPTVDFTDDDWRRLRWGYYRLIEKVDGEIERLLEALRASGREEDTLVLFTSDHGDGHGAHRWNQKTALWEEEIRVPLIASGKGVAVGGRTEARLVSNGLDLLPTVCDYARVEVPDGLPGHSLRPLLEDREVETWRQDLVVETQTSMGEGPGGPALGRAVVGERYKYSVYAMGRWREQLVDLQTDPGEMVNLAVERRWESVLQACRKRLRNWCEETGDEGARLLP
jgi:arylsulfatase A-like enzyme